MSLLRSRIVELEGDNKKLRTIINNDPSLKNMLENLQEGTMRNQQLKKDMQEMEITNA